MFSFIDKIGSPNILLFLNALKLSLTDYCTDGRWIKAAWPFPKWHHGVIYGNSFWNCQSLVAQWSLKFNIAALVSWGSEATPSATPFFKRAYKISHPPRLYVSWVDLPSFATLSKIWPKFNNKVFFNFEVIKKSS